MKTPYVVAALSSALIAAPAHAETAKPSLPEPTGEQTVGTTSLHLVDIERRDPWNQEAAARELMVSLWYPASRSGGKRASYLTKEESAAVLKDFDVPPETLTATRAHARVSPPPSRARLPLVLMSPGFTMPKATLTSLAEDLASRGYLVAAVEHTYESVATTFPDGRTTTCLACVRGQDGAKVAQGRVADLRFVLDQLMRRDLVDRSRIAVVGHSMGGNSAAHTMLADPRVKAAANLDGTFAPIVPNLGKPFLMVGTTKHVPDGKDSTWRQSWANMTGWKRWITVTGADHSSFVDYAVLRPQLGLPAPELVGARALKITRAYLAAFLDTHLRGRDEPLLDGPSTAYPEVRFWK
ncbi:alpha/beta hydrolase family protein [Nonomuraea africana]|uniref:Dienelactone hydrolase n=1 Tax=Nonomuraea africana TaxID=46171 RepID=A0ABR9KMV2_9ACTN|nr:alpha/beta hydrolase [Nonomuraea africana]MBE1563345.1 putative dienelactone hydrolase [Nonomuraea africana]